MILLFLKMSLKHTTRRLKTKVEICSPTQPPKLNEAVPPVTAKYFTIYVNAIHIHKSSVDAI
jgi:hypothetical protein